MVGLAVDHALTRDGLALLLADAGARVVPGAVDVRDPAAGALGALDVLVVAIGADPAIAIGVRVADLRVVALHDGLGTRQLAALKDAGATVTVTLSLTGGTAVAGEDFVAWSGPLTVTVPAGSTSATFTVTVLGDRKKESDEKATVSIVSATGADLGTATGTLTITDDDR